jgi:hypothetical protein
MDILYARERMISTSLPLGLVILTHEIGLSLSGALDD